MDKEAKKQTEKIETSVKDFVSVFPEEKREYYELILRRCNFHDTTDPLYPIMLFLLFFQESVDENVKQLEESITDLKTSFSGNEKEIRRIRKPISLFHYGLLALIIVNLLVVSFGSVRWSRPETVAPIPDKTEEEETPRTELQAIHRYWTRKLAEKTDDRLPYRIAPMIAALAVVGAVSAWIPVLLLHRKHRFPVRRVKRLWERKTGKAVEKEPEPKD